MAERADTTTSATERASRPAFRDRDQSFCDALVPILNYGFKSFKLFGKHHFWVSDTQTAARVSVTACICCVDAPYSGFNQPTNKPGLS
eukprot:SAG11_NODE_449_length_9392_cov_16.435381_4_plen_88_part_00